ncbi:DUF2189 domain-containing protein [Roseitranquillus sediminis]|uniref:DUF2189 domain-containing protein n=1 Tax=Roseitranquillus sediminis TaxID=2809051 RepID=UPI001D0C9C83|nr:DUF2189 domain-containing protein [Roseitranquillus sediminis]MBM9594586.1 DUF2189 domain-containing protein [Roseitranquillus sediminis]
MESEALPKVVPPLPRPNQKALNLPRRTAVDWLGAGWRDLRTNPLPSVLYGSAVFLVSIFVTWGMFRFEVDYFFFPALSGFMVLGPLIATGLYEKSRRLERGERTSFSQMLFVRPASTYQAVFLGLLLLLLFMLWQRAAVLLYALHMGVRAFAGFDEIIPMLFTTWYGWSLLVTGTVIGGLFASFAFAISVFAMPMMLEEKTDALTAMGISLSLVWNNLPVMLVWGAIVVGLFAVSVLTVFAGLIVIFPVLGHATWHAYRAIRTTRGERVFYWSERESRA